MLAALSAESLARLRFPLGELRKTAVRRLARQLGLAVAGKRDSQDLCFLAGTGREAFLARHGALGERTGQIVDYNGRPVGVHRGIHSYTVGQRRGLGVGGGTPLYVLATDADANIVTVGPRSALATRSVALRDAVLLRPHFDRVRLRYRQSPIACVAAPARGRPAPGAGGAGLRRRSGSARLPDGRRADRRPRDDRSAAANARAARDAPKRSARLSPAGGSGRPGNLARHDLRSDPRALPRVLRRPRAPAPAERLARAGAGRHLDADDGRGDAAAEALLRRARAPAGAAPDQLPEGLPHRRRRHRRHDRTPPHLLRDARQLLDRRLLQARRGRVRVGALPRGLRLPAGAHLDHRLRGR